VALKRADRCDACGAQAKVQVYFWTGDLLFCNHHHNEHKEALASQALGAADEDGDLIW
jgi:hypothetical protein